MHSYFVEQESDSLAKSVDLIVSTAAWLAIVVLFSLLRWQRGQSWAATKERTANSVLAAGTFVCGLVVGIAAFLVARADGQSHAAFLSSALANVGAGLVGAAVTFVLFQAFLSRRTPSRDQVAELQAQLSVLQEVIDRPETLVPVGTRRIVDDAVGRGVRDGEQPPPACGTGPAATR